MKKPLVSKKVLLEKFPGKGGWTYARIPGIIQNKNNPFGWVKVKGTIDGYEIKSYHLMPMGNGQLFLPVKTAIRKVIKKEAGSYVTVVLHADNDSLSIPDELRQCLLDEPAAHKKFMSLKESEQKAYIDWIYTAKKEDTKADRIVKTITRVLKGLRFSEKEMG